MTTIEFFAKDDMLYVSLSDAISASSQQLGDDVVLDLDDNGMPVGIEIEDISSLLSRGSLALISKPNEYAADQEMEDYHPKRATMESLVLAEPHEPYSVESSGMMANQTVDRQLAAIARFLTPDRAAQLVDFARFLQSQSLSESLESQDEAIDAIEADNARWDALLATDESQALLERLADEALDELRAGKTRPMVFTDDGRLVLG